MISGRIIVHKEPQRYTANTSQWNRYSGLQDDDDDSAGYWMDARTNTFPTVFSENMLLSIINKATSDGFVVGSRVSRASGNLGIGTITHIHRDLKMAFDEDNREFTPFKVTWDVSPMFVGGTFDYAIDDLKLVSSPSLPLLENKNETVSNLHLSC